MKYTFYIVFSVKDIFLGGSQGTTYTVSSIKVNTTLRNFNNKILLFWKYFCYCEPFVLTGIIYYDTVWCYSIFIFIQWKKFLYFHLFSLFKMIFCFLKFVLCFNVLFSFLKLVIMIFCPCLFISLYYNFRILSDPNLCIFLGGSLYTMPLLSHTAVYFRIESTDWNLF